MLIMGLLKDVQWNSKWGQADKETPANYIQIKYTKLLHFVSKISTLSHQAGWGYNSAPVIL